MVEDSDVHGKLELLKLAKRLGNVSSACKQLGFSRDSFYRFRELFEAGGKQALLKSARSKPNLKNRIGSEVERAVLALSSRHPAWGAARLSRELKSRKVSISAFGIRNIWIRHALPTQARAPHASVSKTVPPRIDKIDSRDKGLKAGKTRNG